MLGWLFLLLCILSTNVLLILLREAGRRNLVLLQAVTGNYVSASLTGAIFAPDFAHTLFAEEPGALPLGITLGIFFISLFFLMGRVIGEKGVAWVSVVSKMALPLPVLFAAWAYGESLDGTKLAAMALALAAVFLINYKPAAPASETTDTRPRSGPLLSLLLLLVLFLGSGANDTFFKIFNHNFAGKVSDAAFGTLIFGTAAVAGLSIMAVQVMRGKMRLEGRSWLFGMLMGIPNFFSIYFLTLGLTHFPAAVFFPVNNVGVLLLGALAGLLLYRERLNAWNLAGLLTAIAAILILAWNDLLATGIF